MHSPSELHKPASTRKLEWLLAAASVVLTLLLAEAVLRLWPDRLPSAGTERDFFAKFDPELGWAPLPNVSAEHQRYGFSVQVRQNSLGLRGPDDMRLERNPGFARRIAFLGDSYVWGFGVNQEELFSEASVHGSDVEIINLGVSGYGTDQELLLYRRLGRLFHADEVAVAFTLYNDVENILAPRQYGYDKPYFTMDSGSLEVHVGHIRERPLRSWFNRLRMQSVLLNTVERAKRSISNRRLEEGGEGHGLAQAAQRVLQDVEPSPADLAGVELAATILARLRDEAEADGSDFSVYFIPYKPNVVAGVAANHPLAPALARALALRGITYYEPYADFLAAGAASYNHFDHHFSALGHRLFAAAIVGEAARSRSRNLYTAGSD